MYFSEDETQALNTRIRQLERQTGIELVAAIVDKCDHYPEIPWKAFAMGAAIGALSVFFTLVMAPPGTASDLALMHILVTLAAGTIMALLTVVWPGWARLFLDKTRAEGEMRQYAQSLVLEHDIVALPNRTGMVLLIGLFEHQVILLPDIGFGDRLPPEKTQAVVDAMTASLKKGDFRGALSQGLNALEECLRAAGFTPAGDDRDRIAEALIQQKGGADA